MQCPGNQHKKLSDLINGLLVLNAICNLYVRFYSLYFQIKQKNMKIDACYVA